MISPQAPFAVQADWIVPVESSPFQNGSVVVDNGIIQFVGTQLPSKFNSIRRFNLAGFAILPGLINSHCHLEFSDLQAPIPVGSSFPEWIRNLLAYRNAKNIEPEQLAMDRRDAITMGIQESYRAGVRWVVDMTTLPWSPQWINDSVTSLAKGAADDLVVGEVGLIPRVPICIQSCIELLDIAPQRFELAMSLAVKQGGAPESEWMGRMGYAPHAPYTTSRNVTKRSVELSQAEDRLVTMHLAESMEEMDWIQDRRGPFSELLGPIISQDYFGGLGQILEHVQLLTSAWRATIAHGNYLSSTDLNNLASHSANCAIVHCPRTHQFFGHRYLDMAQYPLAERMAVGVKHFLGTDSRASNPDLNLWNEAKQVRADHPTISSLQIIKMITTEAAEFLCIQDRYGSLSEGQPATLTAIELPKFASSASASACVENQDDLYDLLLASDSVSSPLELTLLSQNRPSNT